MKNKRILSRALALALTLSMLPTPAMAAPLGDGLTGANKYTYNTLTQMLKNIAANGGTTQGLTLDLSGQDVTYANDKINGLDTSLIVDSLLADLPYHLYWFNKVKGHEFNFSYYSDGTVFNPAFLFHVTSDSADSSAAHMVSAAAAKAAEATRKKADAVIAAAKNESTDYDKLLYCFDAVKELVSYNHNAADNDSTPYGSPWQMTSVFDGDTSTNPVCEGYAKAFKYLCDGLGIDCYLVSGTMSGGTGAGGHMWNIVTLGGNNYLVDVTNCDDSTIGTPDNLFLKAPDEKNGSSYIFSIPGQGNIAFTYDSNTLNLFNSVNMRDVLELAETDYDPDSNTDGEASDPSVSYTVTVSGGATVLTSDGVTVDNKQVAAGEILTVKLSGVVQTGWTLDQILVNGSPIEKNAEGKYTFQMPAEPVTVKATWKEIEKYTITLKIDGSTVGETEVYKGQTMPAPSMADREGFTFLGWFEEGATKAYDFTTPVYGDITLIAMWKANESDEGSNDTTPDDDFNDEVPITPAPDDGTPDDGSTGDDGSDDTDPTPDGKFPVYNYQELVDALSTNVGDITFTPASNFGWPESGTVTIPASVFSLDVLTDSWEIPEGITLYFESNNTGIYCDELILRGTISSKYTDVGSILGACAKVVIDSETPFALSHRIYIPAGNIWEVRKDAVLSNDIRLDGELMGDGTVAGQITIQGGYNGNDPMRGILSGNLTLEDYVQVGHKDTGLVFDDALIIPAGSNLIFKKSLILGEGSVMLDGNAEFMAPEANGVCNISIHTGGYVYIANPAELILHAPSNIMIQAQAEDDDFVLTEDNRYEVPLYVGGEGTIRFETSALAEGTSYYPMGWTFDTLNTCAGDPDKLWLPCCYVDFHNISFVYDGVLLPTEPSDEPEIPDVVTYTVTFDSNGGSAVSSQTVEENGKAVKPADPTREGYRFDGWYDVTGGKFDFGTSIITSDITLTAKWTKIHTVTFDFNGLFENKSFEVEDGSYIDGMVEDPTRAGYEFAGWYLNGVPFDFNMTSITADTVLTARWMQNGSLVNVYTVSFDTGVYGLNIAPQEVEGGSAAKKPADPIRSGYNFLRWLLGTVEYDFAAPVMQSITLTAEWEKKPAPAPAPKPDYDDDDDRDYVDLTGGGSGSGTTGGSSTTTEKNPDGSTTTTTKDNNGTVVENTKHQDGSSVQVKTDKNGTVTTTEKDANGNQTQTVEKADGSKEFTAKQKDGTKSTASVDEDGVVEAEVELSKKAVEAAAKNGEPIQLPIPEISSGKNSASSTVSVDLPDKAGSAKVVIPMDDMTPGTVVILVLPDGTEEVITQTKLTEDGLAVTLTGDATLKVVDNARDFDDVKDSDWFSDATDFVSSRNLFAGTSATEFSPNAPMTMEMLFAVAHNFMGKPETTASGVAGAKPEDWFHTASNWAAEMGLTAGLKMDMLGTNQPISREDTAILLFNLSGKAASYIPSPEALAKLNAFSDIADMDPANRTALAWAVENGIMNGMGDGSFGFKGNNTRAQTGAVMMNFNQKC